MRFSCALALFIMPLAAPSATLEKLSLDEMTLKATAVIRGRVRSCAGEFRGSVIYTHCRVAVLETWKGSITGETDVATLGGTAGGVVQTFSGAPALKVADEYVLFLWKGKSGLTQVIGLSQGVFQIKTDAAAAASSKSAHLAIAERAATGELMLDASGAPVQDSSVRMKVSDLRDRVQRVQAAQRP
ncbi:MAG TPA: hypothetical protein VMZ52_02085 [Bryobacteraceae bacterium]|nr:hypothetical protein [Bryobacteraceae bacterium]